MDFVSHYLSFRTPDEMHAELTRYLYRLDPSSGQLVAPVLDGEVLERRLAIWCRSTQRVVPCDEALLRRLIDEPGIGVDPLRGHYSAYASSNLQAFYIHIPPLATLFPTEQTYRNYPLLSSYQPVSAPSSPPETVHHEPLLPTFTSDHVPNSVEEHRDGIHSCCTLRDGPPVRRSSPLASSSSTS